MRTLAAAAILLSATVAATAAEFEFESWPAAKPARLSSYRGKIVVLYLFSPD